MRICPNKLPFTMLVCGAALCTQANSLSAQTSSVLALPDGRTIEVIGLRRWTIGMLQDSLARYASSDSLQSHACAAILRYQLHFADASSTTFRFGPGTADAIVVSVREPQDSARVRYREMPLDTLRPRKAWISITEVFRNHQNVFWPEVQERLSPSQRVKPQYGTYQDSALARRFASALSLFRRESDRRDAKQVLATDPNMYNRVAAVLILTNFMYRDDAWWSLLDALRESDGPVKSVAAAVMIGSSRSAPRIVNWAPKTTSIHAMLDGTSLFVLDNLIEVLTRTGASPADARAMIGHGGGDMLLAYLGSRNSGLASRSRSLLIALNGRDLGPNIEPWRAWMSTQ
jgi:hypothetical protein